MSGYFGPLPYFDDCQPSACSGCVSHFCTYVKLAGNFETSELNSMARDVPFVPYCAAECSDGDSNITDTRRFSWNWVQAACRWMVSVHIVSNTT